MKKRFVPGLFLLFLSVFLWITPLRADETKGQAEDANSKTFRVENANIKLGKVSAGKDAVGTFIFHNDTDKDVKIIRAKPS